MNIKALTKLGTTLLIISSFQLVGCATNDSRDTDRDRQGQSSMGGKGRGGMRQGPPPEDRKDQNSEDKDQSPPEEAFTACQGKNIGDYVEFTDSKGQLIRATCQDYHDHLVAVPERKDNTDNHR